MASSRVFTKGCGFVVAVWLLLIGAYAYVASEKFREPLPAIIVGVLGGTFAAMLLSSFFGLFTGGRDRGAIRRAATGQPPRDGQLAPDSRISRAAAAGSVWDERDCDKQKTMLTAGADPDERGTDALTPLMNAARLGEPDCVRNLVAAGARLDATDRFSDTALVHAVVAGRDENVRLLLAAGAKDFRVTAATGQPITEGTAPLEAVREYIGAVHRGDFETMVRLMAHTSVRRMEDRRADLPLWQSLRPKRFTVEDGWMTADAATLAIRGATRSGEQCVTYHLERQADGWQIRKEWFRE